MRVIALLMTALCLLFSVQEVRSSDCLGGVLSSLRENKQASSVLHEWNRIRSLPDGAEKISLQEKFFDHWAQENPTALKEAARISFDELMHLKYANTSAYLKHEYRPKGTHLARQIRTMAKSGMDFNQVLRTLWNSSVEIVLTSHPTQIQSANYRQLWQMHEILKSAQRVAQRGDMRAAAERMELAHRIGHDLKQKGLLDWDESLQFLRNPNTQAAAVAQWGEKWLPILKTRIQQTDPGLPRKQTVLEEARETADLYLANMYWATSKLRTTLMREVRKHYGHRPDFDPARLQRISEDVLTLSTWAWDADGKGNVNAQTMLASDGIQQAAIYRLHEHHVDGLIDQVRASQVQRVGRQTSRKREVNSRLEENLRELQKALHEHAEAVALDPRSTAVLSYRPELASTVDHLPPSVRVRSYFEKWIDSLKYTENSRLNDSLHELMTSVKTFYINNHIRQNAAVNQAATSELLKAMGLADNDASIRSIVNSPELQARAKEAAETSVSAILKTEIDRLRVLSDDPGEYSAYISADTKSSADVDRTLLLMEIAGLTGRVRYFPLIENMETFRKAPEFVEQLLRPGSLMRRHILQRSLLTGEPPSLNLMFALSDTNRLGSQAANHLMENQEGVIRKKVAEISEKYPITETEIQSLALKTRKREGLRTSDFDVDIFWGGGSQVARGGDWVTDQKSIHTDQGNARDQKYSTPEMALLRVDRNLSAGIRRGLQKNKNGPTATEKDLRKMFDLIRAREAKHKELFFDPSGYRNALEAYLQFGSMLTESRSNSYGARPTSRAEEAPQGSVVQRKHRLAERNFENTRGKSFDQIVAENGIDKVLRMPLKDLWKQMRPGVEYRPPSMDQRAITTDNAFSETKIHQLAASVDAEVEVGIDPQTSARWLTLSDPPFQSYRRQKMAEVLSTAAANLSSHRARLPEKLRALINDPQSGLQLSKARGKSHDELTVEDLVSTFAFIEQTHRAVVERNANVARIFSKNYKRQLNPIDEARQLTHASAFRRQKDPANFGQHLLAWIHQRSVFGSESQAPKGLSELFPGMYREAMPDGMSDPLGQLEFLAWALHYEGQQLPVQFIDLNGL